jgi:Uma2 family endonuclease
MSVLAERHQVWTFADLQALPADVEWRRFEIVDGALIMSPSAGSRHELVITRLRRVLDRCAPPDHVALGSMAVAVQDSYRIPDLVVALERVALADVNPMLAADVSLVVEVVSPGTRTTDRITKPAQYAAAGIPAYWRVETRPVVTLTVYELESGAEVYTEVGTWGPGQTARLERPFPVAVPIDAITPPSS